MTKLKAIPAAKTTWVSKAQFEGANYITGSDLFFKSTIF
jgi:hypothetical protein